MTPQLYTARADTQYSQCVHRRDPRWASASIPGGPPCACPGSSHLGADAYRDTACSVCKAGAARYPPGPLAARNLETTAYSPHPTLWRRQTLPLSPANPQTVQGSRVPQEVQSVWTAPCPDPPQVCAGDLTRVCTSRPPRHRPAAGDPAHATPLLRQDSGCRPENTGVPERPEGWLMS